MSLLREIDYKELSSYLLCVGVALFSLTVGPFLLSWSLCTATIFTFWFCLSEMNWVSDPTLNTSMLFGWLAGLGLLGVFSYASYRWNDSGEVREW